MKTTSVISAIIVHRIAMLFKKYNWIYIVMQCILDFSSTAFHFYSLDNLLMKVFALLFLVALTPLPPCYHTNPRTHID